MNNYQNFISFSRNLYKKPTGFLPLHEPRFLGNEKKYVLDAIDSTFVSSVGAYVDKFEEMSLAFYTFLHFKCLFIQFI